jgi:hypothetical protein
LNRPLTRPRPPSICCACWDGSPESQAPRGLPRSGRRVTSTRQSWDSRLPDNRRLTPFRGRFARSRGIWVTALRRKASGKSPSTSLNGVAPGTGANCPKDGLIWSFVLPTGSKARKRRSEICSPRNHESAPAAGPRIDQQTRIDWQALLTRAARAPDNDYNPLEFQRKLQAHSLRCAKPAYLRDLPVQKPPPANALGGFIERLMAANQAVARATLQG